jgi:hypothetical protein
LYCSLYLPVVRLLIMNSYTIIFTASPNAFKLRAGSIKNIVIESDVTTHNPF